MPKMKTHSGAKKRFSVTRTGKVQSRAAAKRHRLVSKSKRMKRNGKSTLILREQDGYNVLTYALPYSVGKLSNARKRKRAKFAAKKAAEADSNKETA